MYCFIRWILLSLTLSYFFFLTLFSSVQSVWGSLSKCYLCLNFVFSEAPHLFFNSYQIFYGKLYFNLLLISLSFFLDFFVVLPCIELLFSEAQGFYLNFLLSMILTLTTHFKHFPFSKLPLFLNSENQCRHLLQIHYHWINLKCFLDILYRF